MKLNIDVKGLKQLKTKLKDLEKLNSSELLEAVARPIENATQEAFANETDPWGVSWVNQDSPTYNHLNQTDSMHGSLHSIVNSKKEVIVGVNAVSKDGYNYPAVQQFGTKDERVPARPFLPVDIKGNLAPEVLKDIKESLKEVLEEKFEA